ncbi:MAG: ABC transporter ATP-binding protein [Bernardetiaceae bacterium]|nr:ABC transporter ATP-binding protein [Bernardetiaceae bacterium]
MDNQNAKKRIEDIRELLAENDWSLATRRIMDFVADFEVPAELRKKAVWLRSNYNQNLEKGVLSHAESDKILLESLELLELINENFQHRSALSKALKEGKERKETIDKLEVKQLKSPIFRAIKISKYYESVGFAMENIDIELFAGEISGIVGENGNGKTTLLRIIAGELAIDKGLVQYPAIELEEKDWYGIKQHIAFIPQHLTAWSGLLKDNLHFTAAAHGIKGKENEDIVAFMIHRLGLTRYENETWSSISSGYKLRFELAKALVWKPKLLVLDEPLANLDVNAKLLFMQDLKLIAQSPTNPLSVILSSQQLHEIENIVDNIVFLREGKPLYIGKSKEFGQDRTTNTFEIAGNFNRQDLQALLMDLGEIYIEDTGQSFILEAPISVQSNIVLQRLSYNKQITYFRDISSSTRKLFHR